MKTQPEKKIFQKRMHLELMQFQSNKMKELWDNPFDEVWDSIKGV